MDMIIGIFFGFYASYVIYKLSEFRNLREEASRAISNSGPAHEWVDPLNVSAMAMQRCGHTNAGNILFSISSEIYKTYGNQTKTIDEIKESLEDISGTIKKIDRVKFLQKKVTILKPNLRVLLLPAIRHH
jgi:hypothetical protein